MKIAVLGQGVWGFSLARLLAKNGHNVQAWTRDKDVLETLRHGNNHPHLPVSAQGLSITYFDEIAPCLEGIDFIVESVTGAGLRSILNILCELKLEKTGIVLTSKGLDAKEGNLLPVIAQEVLGHNKIALLSGPSFAQEVSFDLPTAVVMGSYDLAFANETSKAFSSATFRVYPNLDIIGVALGGALKNVIAIACGIADGLKLGTGAKAALMTRGLHEISRLSQAMGCQLQTLYGLSGMGDLFLTCSSSISRNFRFGSLLAQGKSEYEAKKEIGMVVEGASTCHSAVRLGHTFGIDLPICYTVHEIIAGELSPFEAVPKLMQRMIKEEHL